MFKNHLKIAFRNLLKTKGITGINIFGLGVGIAATLLILMYIRFEFSYDDFHQEAERIFRVSIIHRQAGSIESESAQFTPPIGPAMMQDFPEVKNFVRFSTARVAYCNYQDRAIKITGVRYADSTLFNMLSFEWLAGNPRTALAEPYSLVLTPEAARRIFGSEDPIGKVIRLNQKDSYRITGIIAEPPANSHIQFNALISFTTLYRDPNVFLDWNGGNQYYTYVKLSPHTNPDALEGKFPKFLWGYINEDLSTVGVELEASLHPLRDIHLYYSPGSGSRLANIFFFSTLALLILVMACINFINLTTARAGKRSREVGVRKVLGAGRPGLIRQFLMESVLVSFFALVAGAVLIALFFPVYREWLNGESNIFSLLTFDYLAMLLTILIVTGVIAGSYPAFYLSSFQPVETLKGVWRIGRGSVRARNTLVVFQFTISIALIICTKSVQKQLSFMKDRELGFDKENIVVIPLPTDEVKLRAPAIKQEWQHQPGVVSITASSEVPAGGFTSNGYFPEGFNTPVMIHVVDVDEDFLQTYGIELIQGRNFSNEMATDRNAYLVNERLAETLGWENPVGNMIRRNGEHPVIGVVKDFNFATLHDRIEPLIITHRAWRDRFDALSVKINSVNTIKTITALKETWGKLVPELPFEYSFLDESFDRLYKSEQNFREMFIYFAGLALTIALLGLYSLAAYSAEQSTKEIGIRKVFGAKIPQISLLLCKDFFILVIWANIAAWPLAYLAMRAWLKNFAYRVDIGLLTFLLAGLIALIIALLTVGYQAVKAASSNPVEALRYE